MKFTTEQLLAMYVQVVGDLNEKLEATVTYNSNGEEILYMMDDEVFDVSMLDKEEDTGTTLLKEPELPENFEDSLEEEDMLSNDELDIIMHELDSHYKNGGNIYKSESDNEKYVVMNDLHIPFQRKNVIEAIERTYGNKGYNLVLAGDILDCHDISSFPKAYSVGLSQEIKTAKKLFKKWSKLFKKIFVVSGNHEGRLASYLRKRITPEIIEFLPDDILENILRDLNLENIKYVPGDTYNWYVQIDNAIICHPRSFSKASLGTAARVQEFFNTRGFNANMFIVAHTHKLGQAINKGGTIIESGCMCLPQDYAMDGKVSYTPEASGFVVFTSKNKEISFNDVRLHYVG